MYVGRDYRDPVNIELIETTDVFVRIFHAILLFTCDNIELINSGITFIIFNECSASFDRFAITKIRSQSIIPHGKLMF